MFGHKPIWFLPRNIIAPQVYIPLLCKRDKIHVPILQFAGLPRGALGTFQPPNIITLNNPSYELVCYHEYLHYLGQVHYRDPIAYVKEIYFMKKRFWQRKRKRESINSYCAYCVDGGNK